MCNDFTLKELIVVTNTNGYSTYYEYSQYDRAIHTRQDWGNNDVFIKYDLNTLTSTAVTDSKGNLLSIIDPLGNVTFFTCESVYSLVTSITDSLLHQTRYNYDENGNLIEATDALGNIASYTYDSCGNLTRIIDANANTTYFTYDSYGNLDAITDPEGHLIHFTYDILGNTVSTTDARGHAIFSPTTSWID